MSAIDFNGCRVIDDVVKRHYDQLPGKVLIHFLHEGSTPRISTVRSPILGIGIEGPEAVIKTEDSDYKTLRLAFPLGLTVVTNIVEVGDIWWPQNKDDWSRYYSIDELSPEDIDVDSVLLFAADLPRTNLLI